MARTMRFRRINQSSNLCRDTIFDNRIVLNTVVLGSSMEEPDTVNIVVARSSRALGAR